MNLSCIQTIRSRYADLTAAEQKIADCILAHGAAVPQWSAAELAARAGAAPSPTPYPGIFLLNSTICISIPQKIPHRLTSPMGDIL